MATWRCTKCQSENSGNFCSACGEKRPVDRADRPTSSMGLLDESLRKRSRSILDNIKRELDESLKESAQSMEQLTTDLPDLAKIRAGMPDITSNAVRRAEPQRAYTSAEREMPQREVPAFQRVTTRDLKVDIKTHPRLNYALVHCGLPLIESLQIRNTAKEPANDVLVKAWLATDYGEPWQKTIPAISPEGMHQENKIVIPLLKSRLQEVREAEKANLRVDVFTEGNLQFSETYPIEVLAYNEWYYHESIREVLACFVQPNSEAVEKIISLVRDRLRKEFKDTDLSGYQRGSREKVLEMLEALYETLRQDLKLSYINPPPSFEESYRLPDGSITLSQKVFFPEQIFEHRRGTCLDLALMCAACVERMGLNPACFLVRGHAFFGAFLSEIGDWIEDEILNGPAFTDHSRIQSLIEQGDLLPINSTTFTDERKSFADCLAEGAHYAGDPEIFWCMVDIAAARRTGVKPIPPLVQGR